MVAAIAPARATLGDLARHPGKAELVGGELVPLMSTGHRPGLVALRIARRLDDHAEAAGGFAYGDNVGFAVPELSTGRESFSPDAAYYSGPAPADEMRFVPGPPDFAAEVRSEGDYGPAAEQALAAKRAEYFEAGTIVVWDADPVARVVRRYRAGEEAPAVFAAGQEADAEPAVLGWRVAVDWLDALAAWGGRSKAEPVAAADRGRLPVFVASLSARPRLLSFVVRRAVPSRGRNAKTHRPVAM